MNVGDYVVIAGASFDGRGLRASKIVSMTPTGRANLECGTVLNSKMSIRNTDRWRKIRCLGLLTPELGLKINGQKSKASLCNFDYSKLSDEQAVKLWEVVKTYE